MIADSTSLMALAIFMMDFAVILVILRLISRRMQKLRMTIDDILAVCSCVVLVAMCINMITAVAYQRWGAPLEPLTPSQEQFTDAWMASSTFLLAHELMLPLQLTFAKLSILFFYRRLLCVGPRGVFHWITLGTIVITVIWGLVMFFFFVFQCGSDPKKIWDPSIQVQTEACTMDYIELLMAASDLFLDVVILTLPIRRLNTLQISLRKKILVTCIFATGVLSVVAVAIRTYVYTSLYVQSMSIAQMDPNMRKSLCMFWGVFEAGFAVIAACLPNIKLLVDRASSKISKYSVSQAYKKSFGSNTSSSKYSTSASRSGNLGHTLGDPERGYVVTVVSAK